MYAVIVSDLLKTASEFVECFLSSACILALFGHFTKNFGLVMDLDWSVDPTS